jgi:hypothetical protein
MSLAYAGGADPCPVLRRYCASSSSAYTRLRSTSSWVAWSPDPLGSAAGGARTSGAQWSSAAGSLWTSETSDMELPGDACPGERRRCPSARCLAMRAALPVNGRGESLAPRPACSLLAVIRGGGSGCTTKFDMEVLVVCDSSTLGRRVRSLK